MKRKLLCLLLSMLLVTTAAQAAEKPNAAVDTSRSCTLTLQYAASGQTVQLYRAADISSNGRYTLCGAFAGYGIFMPAGNGQAEWDALAAKLRTLPLVKPEARALARFFFASARTLECDKQGRFLVPANLRSYAGITLRQEVVLTGTDSRIEVWSRERWQAYTDEVEPDVTAIAATLTGLGI